MSKEHPRHISLGFTDERASEGQHVCSIYNDNIERRRVMTKYLESEMLEGDKLLYRVDDMTPAEMLDCLEELGVDMRSKADSPTVAEAAPACCQYDARRFDGHIIMDVLSVYPVMIVRGQLAKISTMSSLPNSYGSSGQE